MSLDDDFFELNAWLKKKRAKIQLKQLNHIITTLADEERKNMELEPIQNLVTAFKRVMTNKTCKWTQEEEHSGLWSTECGMYFDTTANNPKEYGMKYCCYCGGKLKQHTWMDHYDCY